MISAAATLGFAFLTQPQALVRSREQMKSPRANSRPLALCSWMGEQQEGLLRDIRPPGLSGPGCAPAHSTKKALLRLLVRCWHELTSLWVVVQVFYPQQDDITGWIKKQWQYSFLHRTAIS